MILTTTPNIEGQVIKEYHGIVSYSYVVSDLKERENARQSAINEISAKAKALGANAIVGIAFCNSHSAHSNAVHIRGSYLILTDVSGTAVSVK